MFRKWVLLNRAPTSNQLHPPPPSFSQLHLPPPSLFQPPPSPIHLHPAHFSLPPALCNTLNNIGTKILHVIVDTELLPIPETRNKSNESYRVCKDNLEAISQSSIRSSPLDVFSWKGVLKICGKFTGEQPCWSVISIKLLCNFIEITLRHGCSPVNLLHFFRTTFPKNTLEQLLLIYFATTSLRYISA